MLRKKKAAEFIGSYRMEVLGDSLTKRLMGFKNGPSGVVELHYCEEGAPVAKRAKIEEGTWAGEAAAERCLLRGLVVHVC